MMYNILYYRSSYIVVYKLFRRSRATHSRPIYINAMQVIPACIHNNILVLRMVPIYKYLPRSANAS